MPNAGGEALGKCGTRFGTADNFSQIPGELHRGVHVQPCFRELSSELPMETFRNFRLVLRYHHPVAVESSVSPEWRLIDSLD